MSQHANVNPLAIGVSTAGNTLGNTGTFQAVGAIEGLGAITLSQVTGVGVATLRVSAAPPVVSAGVSTQGNTAGTTGLAPGSLQFVGGANITLSQSSNASGATVTVVGPATLGLISSFQFPPAMASPIATAMAALGMDGASGSMAEAVVIPAAGSFSFDRIFALISTQSSSITAPVAVSINGSHTLRHTLNVVFYTNGTGANSRSLQSFASGSASLEWMNSVSANSNGSEWTITQRYIFPVEGGYTTLSTVSPGTSLSLNFSDVSNIMSLISSNRVLDIPFPNSLSQGGYWAILGYSSTQSNDLTGLNAALTNNRAFLSALIAAANFGNSTFRVMAATQAGGGLYGAGQFSTAGGGTTPSLPQSAISSSSFANILPFQLLRSA